MSKSMDNKERPGPLFMFPLTMSGIKSKPESSLSGGSRSWEQEPGTILRTNVITPMSHLMVSSPSKKRGRPFIPFRLPTPAEEEEFRAGAGTSAMSTSPSPPKPALFQGDTYLKPSGPNSGLRLQGNSVQLLEAFQNIDLVKKGSGINKPIPTLEFEAILLWIRNEATTLFWTGLHDKFTLTKKLDQTHIKGRAWIELVHEPVINVATSFMRRCQGRVDPLDYITCGEENPDPGLYHAGNVMYALCYLKGLMTGILWACQKQMVFKDAELDEIFEKFYYFGLRALMGNYNNKNKACGSGGASKHCEWCDEAPCNCEAISEGFQNANGAIHGLDLLYEITGPRLFTVIKREIKTKIADIGTEKVDASNIVHLQDWLTECSRAWYTTIYTRETKGQLIDNPPSDFDKEVTVMLMEQYGTALINDLFAVIIEFPESKPLLDDLRICMKEVNLRNVLVTNLKSSLERRLLNAGVNTSEVLEAYIATVRALKYVDPTGILVQLVTPPVREYLKRREETVRVILISLTEEAGELSEELARNPTNPDKTSKLTLQNYMLWNPDPIDVPKDKHNLRKSDLIEAMVSIYGSKTVFIDEYRALLADRLLRMPKPGSITREIKCLELLKLRFGEADLQKCEVMLKDVSDSQRLNTRFYEDEGAVLANEQMQVSALIVSAQFWPSLKQEDIILPAPVTEALEKYTKAFEMIKGNRTLEWQKHIGTVKLEIEHGGVKASFSVSPIQATIIWHFQEQEKWSLDELAKVTGMSSSYISSRIGFWVSKGMIIHTGQGNYALADAIQDSSKATGVIPNKYLEEGDTDSPMASTSSQRATELQVFWSYIEAMLTNLESLPLARIHSMLKLFATVSCSLEELQDFLDDKVSQNLLVYSAGQYQLPK